MPTYERLKFTISNTPGTGSGFTVDTASSMFRTPATDGVPNGTHLRLLITEGTAWEVCDSVYTSGSTSLSRGAFRSSSTGSAVNFTSAAVVAVIGAPGWSVIENTTTSGTPATITFDNIPQTYHELFLGGTISGSSNSTFRIALSVDNGSNYSTALVLSSTDIAATSYTMGMYFPAYRLNSGIYLTGGFVSQSSPQMSVGGLLATNSATGLTTHTGGVNAIQLSRGANNYDAWDLTLYGR